MKVKIKKSSLKGEITVPGSKSHTIRALMFALLSEGECLILNPLNSDDCVATLNAIQKVGAKVEIHNSVWKITGAGKNLHLPTEKIDVKNSGSLMYFLCPILATLKGKCEFTGDDSICKRPVNHLIDSLIQLGAKAECQNGKTPPFWFEGPINSQNELITDGELSQYISGFMMASTRLENSLKIQLTNPKETPYLTMTKKWLEFCGVDCKISDDFKTIQTQANQTILPFTKTIPSDWEGVAFPLIAALITKSEILINNIDCSKSQGDEKIVEILQKVGANIIFDEQNERLIIKGNCELSTKNLENQKLVINMSEFPDAICALTVISCFIEGTIEFVDIEICRKKETDRISAMESELFKLGAQIQDVGDKLVIHGKKDGKNLHGGIVESYKDHRIVMSLATLGFGLNKTQCLTIKDAQWCSVTFPNFFEEMKRLGGNVEIYEL